jgi:hypothetical protein
VTDRVDYDEFGLFHENAAEYDLPFDRPPVVRRAFAEVDPTTGGLAGGAGGGLLRCSPARRLPGSTIPLCPVMP